MALSSTLSESLEPQLPTDDGEMEREAAGAGGGQNRSREVAGGGRSSSNGAHWILSPFPAASPPLSLHWTCASEITSAGLRRSIA